MDIPSWIPENIRQAYLSNATDIPPNITPEYLAESRDAPAIGGIVFLGALTTILLGLRCYARVATTKSFGIDDTLAVLTYVTYLAFIGLCIWLIELGSGRHIEFIEYVLDNDTTNLTEVLDFAAHIIYTTSLFICRLSGLFFYRRLCNGSPKLTTLTTAAGIFLVISYLPQLFLIVFHCLPVTGLWPYGWQDPEVNNYTCIQWGIVYTTNSAISLVSDVIMFIIPAMLITTLQISTRAKINLSAILFPGIIVIGISISRLWLVVEGQWQPDQAWWYDPQLVIECAEIGGTLIALSIPGLKPLATHWSSQITTSFSKSYGQRSSKGASSYGRSHNARSQSSTTMGRAKPMLLSNSYDVGPDAETVSQDNLVIHGDAAIQKTISIQMESFELPK